MTPNRLEAQLATGMTIARPEDALRVGQKLVETLEMEAVLVTLDRDGMALVRADGRAQLVPTRPRQVYDITGAGDMVLSVVGLCLACGADYDEAAELGNIAGGLEVEKIGVALLNRRRSSATWSTIIVPRQARGSTARLSCTKSHRRRTAGQTSSSRTAASTCCIPATSGCCAKQPALGDFLVVGLNSDASVRRLKGPKRPINSEEARAEVLGALECVDAVTIFEEDTPLELIEAILPDVLVKGGDYHPERSRRPGRGRSVRRPAGADPARRGSFDDQHCPPRLGATRHPAYHRVASVRRTSADCPRPN